MKNETPKFNNSRMPFLRLHDMAAAFGDGLIPELYDLYMRDAEAQPRGENIMEFPDRYGSNTVDRYRDAEVIDLSQHRHKLST